MTCFQFSSDSSIFQQDKVQFFNDSLSGHTSVILVKMVYFTLRILWSLSAYSAFVHVRCRLILKPRFQLYRVTYILSAWICYREIKEEYYTYNIGIGCGQTTIEEAVKAKTHERFELCIELICTQHFKHITNCISAFTIKVFGLLV